jgi:two-component system cell cycle sensor histidine kinase/response regulator CckA
MLTLARRGINLQTAVNLNDTVSEYLKSPEHEKICGLHPNVVFEIDLENNLPNIIGSSFHLSKMLMNLVSNAAEAMNGGGKIKIYTSSRQIGPKKAEQIQITIPQGNYAILSVADEGPGISEKDRMRIFEPFYTKKEMGRSGTGLGMTVVSGTVEDHQGFIDLESKEGCGTCFHLYFPITTTMIQQKETPSSIQAYMGSEKILVIDDMKEQRDLACHVLGKLGYQVDSVPSGEAALTYLKENQVDLLILDMMMDPGMDGLETYKKIRNVHPFQKTVIASGFAETDRVKEALRLGAGAYVKKPYTVEKLGTTIREELDRKANIT